MEPSISESDQKFFTVEFDGKSVKLVSTDCVIQEAKSAKQIEILHSQMIRELKVKRDMLD